MNSDPNSLFGEELHNFCDDNDYVLSDVAKLNNGTFTSEAHGTVSWLDHCVCTKNAHDCVNDISVLYDYVDSDHLPLSLSFSIVNLPQYRCD